MLEEELKVDLEESTTESVTEDDKVEAYAKVLPILIWPNDILNQKSELVTVFDSGLEQDVLNLFATMSTNNGVGLAAPQCGIMKNIIVMRIQPNMPFVLINPEITSHGEDEYEWEEGCLSVPGYFKKQKRSHNVIVKFQDTEGKYHETEFTKLYAFVVQHEIDHLHGKTFVDGAGFARTLVIKNKIKKFLTNNKQHNQATEEK